MTEREADLLLLQSIIAKPKNMVKVQTVKEHLAEKYPTGEWHLEENGCVYAANVSGLVVEYRWGMDENGWYGISGRACELVPELDRVAVKIDFARRTADSRELEIYDYWNQLFADNDNEEEVTQQVAAHFEITEEEVTEIYEKIALQLA